MERQYMTYIAHSENPNGVRQSMKAHSQGVADFMREFALSEDFKELFEYCGQIHDIGKYSNDFQRYIRGNGGKTRHAIYGAILAKENSLNEIVFPVYGHHSGLPDKSSMAQDIMAEIKTNKAKYDAINESWCDEIGYLCHIPNDEIFRKLPSGLQKELFVRMLYSALVDADSLDTERHFCEKKFEQRKSVPLDADLLLLKLENEFMKFANDPEKKSLPINKLRNDVRLYAISKANLPQGFFSLTLPTGLGKTLCSVNWALCHSQIHRNIKRIIIVLPFVSIIDQTAEKLKEIFNDGDYVLEHHSNMIYSDNEKEDEYNPKQLSTENWDYPIIITTNVQFFESLFSNKRSDCRKLHNIQDSIIIFDEIQTLPISVTEPTLTMLENLQQLCRCSILFSTATQPDFETRDGFSGINKIESLVENPELVFEQTRRVTYHSVNDYHEIEISELADIVIDNYESALVVFNTKKKARMFYEEIRDCQKFDHHYHLSTTMCPDHRKIVIKQIQEALEKKEKIVVSSTQLIEAGVDMDFPTVYREIAPLESIIQSAGRCNREGKRKNGNVYLFTLTDSSQPSKEYASWSKFANLLYKGKEELLYTHDFYSSYYRDLTETFANTDRLEITDDRKALRFQTVANKYKIIDKQTLSLFVYGYNDKSKDLYKTIKDQEFLSKRDYQLISQYSVQVYSDFVNRNKPFIMSERCGVNVWHGTYDKDYGLPFIEDFKPLIK